MVEALSGRVGQSYKVMSFGEMLNSNIIIKAIAIVVISFALGTLNFFLNDSAPKYYIGHYPVSSPSDTAVIPEAADPTDPPYVSVTDAANLFNASDVLFVDARDEYDYQQGHIKGAINVPFEGGEIHLTDFLNGVDWSATTVIYCGGAGCDLSIYLGRFLKDTGFSSVNIFFGGWNDWKLKDLPTDSGGSAFNLSPTGETEG